MAFSEGQEFPSPSKRIKLDLSDQLSNANVELDFGAFSLPRKNAQPGMEVPDPAAVETTEIKVISTEEPCPPLPSSSNDEVMFLDESKDDDSSSTVSNLSDLSGLTDMSGQEWKPTAGPMCWVQKQMLSGVNPRSLLAKLLGEGGTIPSDIDNLTLWKIIVNIISEPPHRPKLKHVNTLADVVNLVKTSKKIIVLTGAGVSVSCGIPDFRSRGGIYSRLALDFPDLPDPQSMFDIQYFRQDPRPFYKFAREIYPGQFTPSPCHRFIKILEKHKKLLRNYSQNIDTLEQVAGIENVIECHGSFATASCTNCKHKVSADEIRADIFAQRIPLCSNCHDDGASMNGFHLSRDYYKSLVERGVMKPDIVFFGEGLPDLFHDSMAKDKDDVDLMIVIGSTLKVRPVALIPNSIPAHVPQILINREPLPHLSFDIELLGDSDVIINQICHMLGEDWNSVCWLPSPLNETTRLLDASTSWEETQDCSRDSLNATLIQLNRSLPTASGKEETSVDSGISSVASQEIADISGLSSLDSESSESDSGPSKAGKVVPESERRLLECGMDSEVGCASVYVDRSSQMEGTDNAMSGISRVDSGLGSDMVSTCKERHMSIDSSTRDSGLSFNELSPEPTDYLSMSSQLDRRMSVDSAIDTAEGSHPLMSGGMQTTAWTQRSNKESLATRLPDNSYFLVKPNRYIFPGAEVVCDLDQSLSSSSDNSQSDSSDSDSETDYWLGKPVSP